MRLTRPAPHGRQRVFAVGVEQGLLLSVGKGAARAGSPVHLGLPRRALVRACGQQDQVVLDLACGVKYGPCVALAGLQFDGDRGNLEGGVGGHGMGQKKD